MRIAYVEDNTTNLMLVRRVASMNTHEVINYTEGEFAVQELAREKFDLILMDVELAGEMDGLDVVRVLRKGGLTTPIYAVTAYAMMGDRERCMDAGCNGYLPKPIPIVDLLALLSRYEGQLATVSEIVSEAPPQAHPAPISQPNVAHDEPVAANAAALVVSVPEPLTSMNTPEPLAKPPEA